MSEKHTLSVLVENKPGVLTRVSAAEITSAAWARRRWLGLPGRR